MTTLSVTSATTTDSPVRRPSAWRRVAIALSGLTACVLPVVWGLGTLLELVGGTQADHRFHQITGQGLLLSVLWLAGLLPMLRAGWKGRRPSTSAGLAHLAFVTATLVTVSFVPGQGVVAVAAIVAVTGALVWAAIPLRPVLKGALRGVDPVLAPFAMLSAALYTPFVLGERALQGAMADEHAELTHYFDMAWVSIAVVALALVAALSPAARRLAALSSVATVVVGASRLAFTSDVTWSLLAGALGVMGVAASYLRERRS